MRILEVLIWVLVFAAGLAGVFFTVEQVAPKLLLAATGTVSLLIALSGMIHRSQFIKNGSPKSAVESLTARYMGFAWLWGALAILLVYTLLLQWREWPQFVAGFGIVGLLSLGFSALLARDAELGREDATLLRLGRYLCIGQAIGMVVTLIGLAIDPDKEFIYIRETDWAGNSIFLMGAVSLLLLSAHALMKAPKSQS